MKSFVLRQFQRPLVSGALYRALGYAGYNRPLRNAAILNFHSVCDISSEAFHYTRNLTISPEFLEELIIDLRRRKIEILSLNELLEQMSLGGSNVGVAITFDDGYADNFHVAFPILQRHRIPFTIFVSTGFVDRKIPMWWSILDILIRDNSTLVLPHITLPARNMREKNEALLHALRVFRRIKPSEIIRLVNGLVANYPESEALAKASAKPLTWPMIKAMARSGLVTFGSHTVHHPVLSHLTADESAEEIFSSRDRLTEELGAQPEFFAYPYGDKASIGSDAPRFVARAGFRAAFSTHRDILYASELNAPYMLPRIAINGHHQHRGALSAYLLMAEKRW